MKLIAISSPTHVFLDSTIAEQLLNQLKTKSVKVYRHGLWSFQIILQGLFVKGMLTFWKAESPCWHFFLSWMNFQDTNHWGKQLQSFCIVFTLSIWGFFLSNWASNRHFFHYFPCISGAWFYNIWHLILR